MKSRKVCSMLIMIFMISMLSSCTTKQMPKNTIQSISFDYNEDELSYTVMIKEYNEFVPYLVLTDNYNGTKSCLLLRKNLLEEYHIYNENIDDAGYYGNSEIDRFLNEEVYISYSNEMQNLILDTKLEVTSKDSLEFGNQEVREINRKIFLLSNTEVGYYSDSSRLKEGEWIKYFNCGERRIATKENGDVGSWWLRTPNIAYENVVLGVTSDGISCSGGIAVLGDIWEDGVRPALCLSRETAIVCVDGVNYIEADYNSMDVTENIENRSKELYSNLDVTYYWEADIRVTKDYRPYGYDKNIGNALAIQMEANKENSQYKYHVVFYPNYSCNINEVLYKFNNSGDGIVFNKEYWYSIENKYYSNCYYYIFTAEEIYKMIKYGFECYYVGSGKGSLNNANWDTIEGIYEYCELLGDGYVAQ